MSGRGIERAKLYLKKIVKLTINEDNWTILKSYNIIRNSIVHNGNGIKTGKDLQNLKNFEKKTGLIKISQQNRLTLEKKLCYEAIKLMNGCLVDLYRNLSEKIKSTASHPHN